MKFNLPKYTMNKKEFAKYIKDSNLENSDLILSLFAKVRINQSICATLAIPSEDARQFDRRLWIRDAFDVMYGNTRSIHNIDLINEILDLVWPSNGYLKKEVL